MIVPRRDPLLWFLALALSLLQGCGKKGPPQAPLVIVPEQIADLSVHRLGSTIYVQFTIPSQNQDGSGPADLGRVDLYGLTMNPVAGGLDERAFLEHATLVASIEVRPPPQRDREPVSPPERTDGRPAQGEVVTVVDRLSPAVLTPVELEEPGDPAPKSALGDEEARRLAPLGSPMSDPLLRRSYLALAFSRSGRRSPASLRVAVLLSGSPPSPPAPSLGYSEDVITVRWQPAGGTRQAAQVPATATGLPEQPIVNSAPAFTYNVYEVSRRPGPSLALPVPLNASPLQASPYEDARVEFGVERCYVVRTVDTLDGFQVQSEASLLACVTPIDTFPPARPAGLMAVGDERAISLIWAPSPEEDLGGYLILRGRASDETLQRLIQVTILETTYLDTTVDAGVRYVYAIVAVDMATPPNESAPSERVEELAR